MRQKYITIKEETLVDLTDLAYSKTNLAKNVRNCQIKFSPNINFPAIRQIKFPLKNFSAIRQIKFPPKFFPLLMYWARAKEAHKEHKVREREGSATF